MASKKQERVRKLPAWKLLDNLRKQTAKGQFYTISGDKCQTEMGGIGFYVACNGCKEKVRGGPKCLHGKSRIVVRVRKVKDQMLVDHAHDLL